MNHMLKWLLVNEGMLTTFSSWRRWASHSRRSRLRSKLKRKQSDDEGENACFPQLPAQWRHWSLGTFCRLIVLPVVRQSIRPRQRTGPHETQATHTRMHTHQVYTLHASGKGKVRRFSRVTQRQVMNDRTVTRPLNAGQTSFKVPRMCSAVKLSQYLFLWSIINPWWEYF